MSPALPILEAGIDMAGDNIAKQWCVRRTSATSETHVSAVARVNEDWPTNAGERRLVDQTGIKPVTE